MAANSEQLKKRRGRLLLVAGFLVLLLIVVLAMTQVSLSALDEPGQLEMYVAHKSKRFLIGRASHRDLSAEPAVTADAISEGERLFDAECATCHGQDGHLPTNTGRWMYPRASDLTSPEVQEYSDKELFWIVQNGIKLSGMPAFGKVINKEQTWEVVHYVRSLKPTKP